jgi:hypothetical protein
MEAKGGGDGGTGAKAQSKSAKGTGAKASAKQSLSLDFSGEFADEPSCSKEEEAMAVQEAYIQVLFAVLLWSVKPTFFRFSSIFQTEPRANRM